MNILVVGGGGREAALVHKIKTSERQIFCAPGNAGIARLATPVPIGADKIEQLLSFAKENAMDFTVVGPEIPLSLGIVDQFRNAGLKIFGPTAKAAHIETSKAFSKQFMQKYKIPTPSAEILPLKEAYERVAVLPMPIVLKQDELAAGKGVCIVERVEDARSALDDFAARGATVVLLEQYLTGVEASFFVIADGDQYIPFSTAQDYKRLLDNDIGPNTGGMGAISPSPVMTSEMAETILSTIVRPALKGMIQEGIPYTGILYAGLMITEKGPFVLEFNARMGDPEAQGVLPRLTTDWMEIMEAAHTHRLDRLHLAWREEVAVTVVLAAPGYPGKVQTGSVITGLEGDGFSDAIVFHAGTILQEGQYRTQGGRVLSVTALGKDVREARARAYGAVEKISFPGMQYRRDIGL